MISAVPGVAEAEVRYTEVVLATVLLDAHRVPRHQADVLREAAQALHTSTAGILYSVHYSTVCTKYVLLEENKTNFKNTDLLSQSCDTVSTETIAFLTITALPKYLQ